MCIPVITASIYCNIISYYKIFTSKAANTLIINYLYACLCICIFQNTTSRVLTKLLPLVRPLHQMKSHLEGDPHHRVWSQPGVSSNGLVTCIGELIEKFVQWECSLSLCKRDRQTDSNRFILHLG